MSNTMSEKYYIGRTEILNHHLIPYPARVVRETDHSVIVESDYLYGQHSLHKDEGIKRYLRDDYKSALILRAETITEEVERLLKWQAVLLRASKEPTETQAQSYIQKHFGTLKKT